MAGGWGGGQAGGALEHGPYLQSPAPSRCWEGKGNPEQCGQEWLHAHKNISSVVLLGNTTHIDPSNGPWHGITDRGAVP